MTESAIVRATFPSLELRVPDRSERIIEGIVVPWGETSFMTADPRGERFAAGALTRSIEQRGDRVKLYVTHDHDRAVGRALAWDTEHPAGLWTRMRVAETSAGDDALSEVEQGMLDAFSIGFRPIRHRRGTDGAREILEAALHEVSLCPMGAYDGARVLATRTPAPALWSLPTMPTVNLTPLPPLVR